jgi:hypothetical protein
MTNKVAFLTNGFFQGRRMNRRADSLHAAYMAYNSELYKLWNAAGAPHGMVWRYKGRAIAVRLSFYNTQDTAILLRDNGDRNLPVYNRLASVLTRTLPSRMLVRTHPRRGIWHIVGGEQPELWLGRKICSIIGARAPIGSGRLASVNSRLTDFMARNPVNLSKWDAQLNDTWTTLQDIILSNRVIDPGRSLQPPDNENDDPVPVIPANMYEEEEEHDDANQP